MNPVIIPLIVIAAFFDISCLVDLLRTREVSFLPKWAWAIVILVQCPFGGILYLACGHVWDRKAS